MHCLLIIPFILGFCLVPIVLAVITGLGMYIGGFVGIPVAIGIAIKEGNKYPDYLWKTFENGNKLHKASNIEVFIWYLI